MREVLGGLPEPWRVLHSVSWQSQRNGRQGDGEADFVLLHPDHGALVVEVKGGLVCVDEGTWFSTDRHGERHLLKSPYDQAVASKHALHRLLRDTLRSADVPVGHAVALPDVEAYGLGPTANAAITWDRSSTLDIVGAVEATVAHWSMHAALRRADLDSICSMLLPTTMLRPLLRDEIAAVDDALARLTDEQVQILEGLRRNRRAVVYGGAGTGKSVLAVHRAVRLAEQGFRVLLTCFNQPLAQVLATQASAAPSVRVSTFHQLCVSESRAAGMAHRGDGAEWWNEILPSQLSVAAGRNGTSFDAIVVDEGQDFAPDWWLSLQLLLPNPDDDPLHVFADTHQAIYRPGWTPPFEEPAFELTINCRNSRPIAARVARVFEDEPPIRGAEGPEPVFTKINEFKDIGEALRKSLHRILREEHVPAAEVAVLSDSRPVVDLLRMRSFGNLRLGAVGTADLTAETVHRFKGLEAAAILLIVPPGATPDPALLYIGMSRARGFLEIIGDRSVATYLGWA